AASGDSAGPGLQWRWLRPSAVGALNTTFAYNVLPGPAWDGRGLTVAMDGGIVATWGRFRAQIDPTFFASENASFDLAPNGLTGTGTFRDARFPKEIDFPQRFGAGTYSRLDPGNTTLSLDLSPVLVGLSSAAQSWGPAREFPLVLSANSGGFRNAFLATKAPLDLWLVRLHGRLIGGTLEPSGEATPVPNPLRWATGVALTLMPRGMDGLEIGGSRFVSAFSESGIPSLANVRRLFSRGLRATLNTSTDDNISTENQLASVWFRWAVPRTATEFYGEYYREDYSLDLRWFLQYPDDLATYVLGLQHVCDLGDGRLRALRFEIVNGELSSSNKRQRASDPYTGRTMLDDPYPPYLHYKVLYGHTNHGLLLGSPEAYGGAAVRAGWDDYDSRGRTSFTFERQLRFDWLPGTPSGVTPHPDVIVSLRAERFRFVGDREFGVTVMPMLDLNRDLHAGQDRFNLAAAFSMRGFR
ncbi:MAG TPA: capsule assembly Wzi family protein, partial [Gemmatimonadaceae bacterium]|nr:capsule assembly Wzi family protein [Gemmatimonadaceae bacterium]